MRKVQLESEVVSELIRDRQHLELCDEHGRAVGYFVPADLYIEMAPRPATNDEYQLALSEVSVEENDRRLRKAGLRNNASSGLQEPESLS